MKLETKLLFLLLIVTFSAKAQYSETSKSSIKVKWTSPVSILDNQAKTRLVPNFEEAFHIEPQDYLPSFVLRIYNERVQEITIYPDSTESMGTTDGDLIRNTPSDAFETKIFIRYYKGKPLSEIYIVPIKASAGSFQKIHKFSYTYKTSQTSEPLPVSSKIIKRSGKSTARTASTSSSVLSSGDWYKLSISNSGVFKIDYNFLTNLGLNPSSINPKQIKIYGNGGGMLSQKNDDPRYDDLVENAIFISGEADGKFDQGDFIIFYGAGPHPWSYDFINESFNHTFNIYSDFAYYFLTIGPDNGLRIPEQVSETGAEQSITQFDDRYFFEKDEAQVMVEPIKPSGRLWIGDIFNYNLQYTYPFDATGIIPNSDVLLRSSCIGRSSASSSFNISLNNVAIGTHNFTNSAYFENPNVEYPYVGEVKNELFKINSSAFNNSSNILIKYVYNKAGKSEARGYHDYFEIFIQKQLRLYGNQTSFRSIPSLNYNISEFKISGTQGTEVVWDITDPLYVKKQNYSFAADTISFSTNTSTLKEFVIFNLNNLSSPGYIGKIANQNLHGIIAPNIPENIIITTDEFEDAANQLAQFHKSYDNQDSYVVTVKKIYNEFSSGAQDITAIRDFIKMVYDRSTPNDSLHYVTLFGDCSMDYKDRLTNNTNFVPTYESRQSLHPIFSYSSDDYYGFMDSYEGEWVENISGDATLDVGIGRLPVKSAAEAYAIVDKIKIYKSNQSLGKWRNRITLVADNQPNSNLHLNSAELLASKLEQNQPNYNINKVYMAAFPLVYTPSGPTCPAAAEVIQNDIDKGIFLLNYTGHGGELQLAQENILNTTIISKWKNIDQLPFLVAATCQFGRYDYPAVVSGIETAILNANGGAIGSLASTRPVYSNTNEAINVAFYNAVFQKKGNRYQRLGEIMMPTKNKSNSGINNRNYSLLADPALTLNYPIEDIVLTKVNDINVSGMVSDTIKALEKVKLEGEVRSEGIVIGDYNGVLNLTLYDKKNIITTIENPVVSVGLQNSLIYDGPASVKNGKFSLEFVIPKDISYQYSNGKASFYASNSPNLRDAAGASFDLVIGGTNKSAAEDNTPPVIKTYLNDETFVFGGATGSNPKLIIKLFDENGINLASAGIGHEISMTIDNSNEVITLNEFYSSGLDDYKNGTVNYPLKDLAPGNHSIKIRAWDTYNNSSEVYLEFVVVNNESISLEHILNYPNPFSTNTEFHFDHNRAGEDIDVMIQIYTVSGKLIKTISNRLFTSPSHVSGIHWDGRDDFGDKIGKGVYVYKLNVKSLRDGNHKFKYQKLVVLN
ncbi:type IX secretion system sortase PorU [Sporocytophaga myxococcoides]|uniref:type IX secretion system sortase PorU n=1 Tax=Sporocytophaga myxococcoides TaxID=153721 RepID=UPI0003FE5297|nr:type IX secretion system sortase PorU [Sporocytophaga myxococcoides]